MLLKSIYFWFTNNINHANVRKIPLSFCQALYERVWMLETQVFRENELNLYLPDHKLSPRQTEDVSFVLLVHDTKALIFKSVAKIY